LLLIGFMLIAVGLVAVYLLTRQFSFTFFTPPQIVQPTQAPVVKNKAVVLTRDMKLGDVIKESDLSTIEVPAEVTPRDVINTPAAAVGKFLRANMVQGEMLTQNKLADPTNVNQDLAFALSEDHVMMAILFNDLMTQQSIVRRGDIVDILVTSIQEVDSTPQEGAPTGPTLRTTPSGAPQPAPTPRPEPNQPQAEPTKVARAFTFDALQKISVTGLVMDVITETRPAGVQGAVQPTATPGPPKTVIKAYLLALKPQDALILKYLKDSGAIFDIVVRAPTSTGVFELTPVTQEYIIEFYALQILR
jgi:Flp pilus assembly protein CpaB